MTAVTGNTGYNVVMVGGRAAGCVVATRLSEDWTRQVRLSEAQAQPPVP